jgi:hypothetical protein
MATYTLNLFPHIGAGQPTNTYTFDSRAEVQDWLDQTTESLIFEVVPTYDDLPDALAECVTEIEHDAASVYVLDNLLSATAQDMDNMREALTRSLRMLLPKCSHCGTVLVGEDCPNYGDGPEHAEPATATSAVTGEPCC